MTLATASGRQSACPSCGNLLAGQTILCPECGLALGSYDVRPVAARALSSAGEPEPPPAMVGDLDGRYRILRPINDAAAVHSLQAYVAQDLKCRNCGTVHEEDAPVCDTCGLNLDEEITLICQISPRQAEVCNSLLTDLLGYWPERLIRCRAVFSHDQNPFAVLSDGMSSLDHVAWSSAGDFYEEGARIFSALTTLSQHGYRVPYLDVALGVSGQQLVLTPLALQRVSTSAAATVSGIASLEQTAIGILQQMMATADRHGQHRAMEVLYGVLRLMEETAANYLETATRSLMEAAELARRLPSLRLICGRVSSEGVVRRGSPNEDSATVVELSRVWVAEPHSFGFYGVADGMGGHEAGEVASRLALEILTSWVMQKIAEPWLTNASPSTDEIGHLFMEGVERSHQRVRDGGTDVDKDMGTTLTAALVIDTMVFVVNVGDSRTYLWRSQTGLLQQLSHDHSVVQELVDRGELAPQDVYSDPRRNVILASLGAPSEDSGVDLFVDVMEPGDRLLLCSDGLWEMVYDHSMAAVMERSPDPQFCAEELVSLACSNGGVDNVTALVVQLQERPAL